MKIAYFINTFKSINWGGQATSTGIKHMLMQNYPNAIFTPIDLPDLPFKKIKLFRKIYDYKLQKAILTDDYEMLIDTLETMNISKNIFDDYSHICFNGEGAIHYKSGHLILLMALLMLAKYQNKTVSSINQTVDLGGKNNLEKLLTTVYNKLDFVSVREPLSLEYLHKLGLQNIKLIPDAVYGLKKMNNNEINEIISKYKIADPYIALTGSSILKRDKKSISYLKNILDILTKHVKLPIIFMANAKTDIWLANKLKNQYDFTIIQPPTKYKEAMAIIAKATMLIGGRQHPNIFAYIYHTPYIPFEGNTFKNKGVALLQQYPIKPLNWDITTKILLDTIQIAKNVKFKDIKIEKFDIFNHQ
jgi:polysaccharide pyruvyl transferase WcaK-like protein